MKNKIINFSDILGAQQHPNPLNTTPETVLDGAKDKLSVVLVMGMNKTNESIYIASSTEDAIQLNFIIDIAKKRLLDLFEPE
jgi:hypothetical protein